MKIYFFSCVISKIINPKTNLSPIYLSFYIIQDHDAINSYIQVEFY